MSLTETEQASVSEWVAEWKEKFSTNYAPHDLEGLFGQKVRITRPGDEQVYEMTVVGYSKTVLHDGNDMAVTFSVLTADGRQVQLRTGVVIELAD